MSHKRSFTLIELMIVVIIVGVLAATAAPMMRKSIIRSKWSEAIAALGTIRTAERVYYIEYGDYKELAAGSASDYLTLGLNRLDFDGRYFSNNSYTFYKGPPDLLNCYLNQSTAPKANELNFNNSEMARMNLNNGQLIEMY